MPISFSYGFGSFGLPPTSRNPVNPVTETALREAYHLAIDLSCCSRALAVCAPALKKAVANYTPGVIASTLRIPFDSVAPPAVAHAVASWYRLCPFEVVVDVTSAPYDSERHFSDSPVIYITGEIAAGLSASFEMRSAYPQLWRRHLLLTAIVMAREMFCHLRYMTHCMIAPPDIAKHAPAALWSYTSGHHASYMYLRGTAHIPGEAGWWWEDKTIGGSIEGLLYDARQHDRPRMKEKQKISASPDSSTAIPIAFIQSLALRSGFTPGLWGRVSQDKVDELCTSQSMYMMLTMIAQRDSACRSFRVRATSPVHAHDAPGKG
ncbi:hypothetical protein D9615_005998 [Tricholomella constricta]|uniref:Uncharacterized protein n=1 Tax=Tricholomella constricta TaxID=117010 RepID=A0A8H5M327_9AGAR|nr:hypothetical protein D9615_005998 [Tricholomella constricta]